MNKEQKTATIEEIAAQIKGADAIFAVDYRGISVPQAAELRTKLREADASFRVVKNRLTKRAAKDAGEDRLEDLLTGPTALTFVSGDTALAAKTLSNFQRENDVLTFKGGFMDGLTLDEERFKSIARLPGRDILNGQLAGVVASPLTGLVRGLGSMIQGLALQLGQIAEKGLVSGEAPAGPAAAGDPPPPAVAEASSEEVPPATSPAGDASEDGAEGAPADEAEEASADSSAEEEPSKPEGGETSSAEDTSEEASQSDSSPSSEGEPGTEQAEADSHTPAGEAEDVGGSGEETSDSADDESKEEE